MQQTLFAVAKDETRPMLTGICFEMNGNTISFVALDGYRLAVKQSQVKKRNDTKENISSG